MLTQQAYDMVALLYHLGSAKHQRKGGGTNQWDILGIRIKAQGQIDLSLMEGPLSFQKCMGNASWSCHKVEVTEVPGAQSSRRYTLSGICLSLSPSKLESLYPQHLSHLTLSGPDT